MQRPGPLVVSLGPCLAECVGPHAASVCQVRPDHPPHMQALVSHSAVDLVRLVHAGDVSPREIVAVHLERIAARDSSVGGFRLVRFERALAEARALEALDLASLPLAGVPVAIKDNIDVEGEPTRHGSLATSNRVASRDHEIVRRLRAAGAIVIGKTQVPELSVWGTSDGPLGTARNPWDLARTAGGSSGGSAAVVAAGMVPIAHGSDGLGSIRIPAAVCGVVGIKPGTGVVPSDLGSSAWFGMAENGVLATTVDDAALALSVMSGDPQGVRLPPSGTRLRIALSLVTPLRGTSVDPEMVRAAVAIGDVLGAAGHQVLRVDPAYPAIVALAVFARWCGGAAEDAMELDRTRLQRRTRGHVRAGWVLRTIGALRDRDKPAWRARMAAFFASHDALVTPALAQVPIRADGWADRSWRANIWANVRYAPFCAAWNLAGFPAASVPAGMHPAGVPVAVQIIAPAGGESVVLALARQISEMHPWPRHAPEV
jgi:amidase